jgi:AraC-like DNA-binding protein/tetratricopeptide (TPR) repeat protein
MLGAQSPLEAYRQDLARYTDREAFSPDDGVWLLVASRLHHMAQLPEPERLAYAAAFGEVAGRQGREGSTTGAALTSVDELWSAFRTAPEPGGVETFFETVRRLADCIEDAGAFELAFSCLFYLLRALSGASSRARGRALVQQARIARHMRDLDAARDLYDLAADLGLRTSDPELLALSAYGEGGLLLIKGNYPDARERYETALAYASGADLEDLVGLAHRGLMITSAESGDLDAALLHGWAAFERASGDRASQAELLGNLAGVCRKSGELPAALQAYLSAAAWAGVQRVELPALGGAALVAAELERRAPYAELRGRVEAALAGGAPPFETAEVTLELAEGAAALGDAELTRHYVSRVLEIASTHPYFEIRHNAEQLASGFDAAVTARRPWCVPPERHHLSRASTGVVRPGSAGCGCMIVALVTDPRVRVVIVEPRDAAGTPVSPLVRELRRGYPSISVLACCALSGDTSREILDMARAGVHALLLRGIDDGRLATQAVLPSAQAICIASVAMGELSPLLPPEVQPFVHFCLENAGRSIRVEEAASALGVHRRTLVHRLAQAGLPAPSAIIGWCRLTLAARLLEDPDRRLEHIAVALDFPSASALRNMLRRYTALRPQEVRQNGGLTCVLDLFKCTLATARPHVTAE